MKIVQFGLHYSPNVGDGVISETLGHAIRRARPGVDYRTVDISGRSGFGAVTVRNRALALAVLGVLPRALRGRVVEARLGRMLDRVAPDWRAALEGADLAVIGGGQVFSDADLNFCTKVARVADLTRAAQVPVVIHAAGVSGNWSPRGTELFARVAQGDLRAVGLRDDLSIAQWRAQMPAGPEPGLTRDPGLLAAPCYGDMPGSGRVALGITAPQLLRYHSDSDVAGAGQGGLAFYSGLAQALCARGHQVQLFCNGAAEDRAAMARVAALPQMAALSAAGQVTVAPAPDTPAALAALIGGAQAVVAHRMHACIVAYSYRVPVVGLGWDRKMESFFASVDQLHAFVRAAGVPPDQVADRVDLALSTGIDGAMHQAALDQTQAAVDRMLDHASRP